MRQDWTAGRSGELRARAAADAGTRAMLDDHAEHGGMAMAHPAMTYAPLDRMVAAVAPLQLAAPVLIAPPTGPNQPWTAKSDAADRPLRADLTLDPATGAVLTRKDFAERRLVDRLVGYGIAVHEGALFGWLNQLLNLVTALGLMLVAVSGAVMWWRRRPSGKMGAPEPRVRAPATIGFIALVAALGLTLPLFGASLVAVLLVDRLISTGR